METVETADFLLLQLQWICCLSNRLSAINSVRNISCQFV